VWHKNGVPFEIDNQRITWHRPRTSGTIIFNAPTPDDQGYYQCFVTNIFGTAVSQQVNVRLGGKGTTEV
jgi:hypothetical protein